MHQFTNLWFSVTSELHNLEAIFYSCLQYSEYKIETERGRENIVEQEICAKSGESYFFHLNSWEYLTPPGFWNDIKNSYWMLGKWPEQQIQSKIYVKFYVQMGKSIHTFINMLHQLVVEGSWVLTSQWVLIRCCLHNLYAALILLLAPWMPSCIPFHLVPCHHIWMSLSAKDSNTFGTMTIE